MSKCIRKGGEVIHINSISKIEEATEFISMMNKDITQHVGYCGENHEEILDAILHGFSDIGWEKSFVVSYNDNNEIVGVLGFDIDKVSESAEIWGPFIIAANWGEIALSMWKKLIEKIPLHIQKFHGFYHVKNSNGIDFMKYLQAKKQEKHSVLILKKTNVEQCTINQVEEASQQVFEQFIVLHNNIFPNTYYEGNEIIERLSDTNKLFVSMKNGKLEGYVYVEVNPEFHEANIEFIATAENSRRKGVGERILQGAIQYIFSFQGMREIVLCLNTNNDRAMKLYKKVGFEEKACLQHYIIE